jgi:hypothetical protein
MRRRWVATVVAVVIGASSMAGCGGQVRARVVKAFVRERGGVSLTRTTLPSGETIIKIKNDSREPARMVLARVSRDGPLPVGKGGVVDVGDRADVEHSGDGYRVLVKIDDLAPFFANANTSAPMHLFLRPAKYVLFSNRPGDYAAGRWVEFTVRKS